MIRKVLQLDTVKKVKIEKVEAHSGLMGNDKADEIANHYRKQAFRDTRSTQQWNHRTATMFLREKLRKTISLDYRKLRLEKIVNKENSFYNFITKPTKKMQKALQKLNRVETHMIVRILCDRLPLNVFQFTMKNTNTPTCSTCGKVENTNHFIFTCQKYQVQRNAMLNRVKSKWGSFCRKKHFTAKKFIYGYFIELPPKKKRLVDLPTQVIFWKNLCLFVAETGRFTDLFGGGVRVKAKER